LWAALQHPVLFLVFLGVFAAFAVWLLPKIWRGLKRVIGWIRRKLSGESGYGEEDGGPIRGADRVM